MKKLLPVVCCVISLLAVGQPGIAQDTTIVETSSHSVFTGLFRSVWARLKSFNPSQKESARSEAIFTAGIRGAESTDTLLKPYWKNDLTQDEAFQAELQKFTLAQIKLDQGDLKAAIQSFDGFMSEFGQSSLRPNAMFGKGLSQAGLGQKQPSLATMRQFVVENPNHPLIEDARHIITELN